MEAWTSGTFALIAYHTPKKYPKRDEIAGEKRKAQTPDQMHALLMTLTK